MFSRDRAVGRPIVHNGQEYLDLRLAATFINSTYNTVKAKHGDWGWTKYKIGQKVYFKKSDIQLWLDSRIKPLQA
jgi:hypothetical protein